jgi:hypothetical protein
MVEQREQIKQTSINDTRIRMKHCRNHQSFTQSRTTRRTKIKAANLIYVYLSFFLFAHLYFYYY